MQKLLHAIIKTDIFYYKNSENVAFSRKVSQL